jgi:hypothetical protein
MRKTSTALLAVASSAATLLGGGTAALASSHREAPFLTENPKVDGTDFYMFRSYETGREDYVTFIANYLPLQDPYGGPNFFTLDPDALYEIMVDNNGDATEDLTFQFRFTTNFTNIKAGVGMGANGMLTCPMNEPNCKTNSVPLVNIGAIPSDPMMPTVNPDANRNYTESYTVTVVRGARRTGTAMPATNANGGGNTFSKPSDLIGQKSSPNYEEYAKTHVHGINIPGCATAGKVFVGQRKDPFVVNLGEIFDLVNIDVMDASGASMCDSTQPTRDILVAKNVTAIAVEVPIACLTSGTDPVIGAWTTASLRQARVLNRNATYDLPAKEGGAWAQVSRLGHPLVNEIVIGLQDKNRFNASHPSEDAALFLDYVTHPTLPKIIGIVFAAAVGVNLEPQTFPRADLVQVFLQGIPDLTAPTSMGAMPSEQLRLNTTIAPVPAAMQSPFGVLGGDTAGFPNGRRLIDDIVDIELRAAMGALLPAGPTNPARDFPLTDCAPTAPGQFDETFPYMKSPVPGSRIPMGT